MAAYAPPDRLIRHIKEESLKKNPSDEKIRLLVEEYLVKLTNQVSPNTINTAITSALKAVICLSVPWNQFSKEVNKFDYAIKCSKVWDTDYYGYRCRTCSLSPCMSLCGPCFLKGDHKGHDFNRFRSQSGGACDCGDPNVLKPMGFCCNHGIENVINKPSPPASLLLSARHVVPHLFAHLGHRFRNCCWPPTGRFKFDVVRNVLREISPFMELFEQLSNLGAAMQLVIREVLLDRDIYAHLMGVEVFAAAGTLRNQTPKPFSSLLDTWIAGTGWLKCEELEREADDINFSCFKEVFTARHFLDEFIFWVMRFRFPDQLGHSFLGLLTEDSFRAQFAEAFCTLYPAMVKMVETEAHQDMQDNAVFSSLHNRFVHISVQLLSGAGLAVQLVKRQGIFEKLLGSVFYLLCQSTNQQGLDMNNPLIVLNSTWPFMSDLQNLLSHTESMDWLLSHENTQRLLLRISGKLQGMNMNHLMVHEHVEHEVDSHYTAFNLENELVAFLGHSFWSYPSWTSDNIHSFLYVIALELQNYFRKQKTFPVGCEPMATKVCYSSVEAMAFSYHIPLHRLFSCVLAIGTRRGLATLESVTTRVLQRSPVELTWAQLANQPLRVITGYSETRADLWRRNGFTMSAQAFMYTNHNFDLHFVQHDIFLVQAGFSQLSPNRVVCDLLRRFHLHDTRLTLFRGPLHTPPQHRPEDKVEGLGRYALLTLAWIICQRTYCGLSMDEVARKNMVSALAVNERSHSDVRDYLPDRSGSSTCLFSTSVEELMRTVLDEVATLRPASVEESSGRVKPALYGPSARLWLKEFDPLYLQLQHQSRGKNLQAAMNNYCQFTRIRDSWPPYRLPSQRLPEMLHGLEHLTQARSLHAFLLLVLTRYIDSETQPAKVALVNERALALVIFLLELAVFYGSLLSESSMDSSSESAPIKKWTAFDGCLESYFPEDNIFTNICHRITNVRLCYFTNTRRNMPDETCSDPFPEGVMMLDYDDRSLTTMDWTSTDFDYVESLPVLNRMSSGSTFTVAPTSSGVNINRYTTPKPQESANDISLKRHFTVQPGSEESTTAFNPSSLDCEVEFNESILSLLIRIHDMLGANSGVGRLRIFNKKTGDILPDTEPDYGDGAFYIQRLLRRAARASPKVMRALRKLIDTDSPVSSTDKMDTECAGAEAMETESKADHEDSDAIVDTKEQKKKRLARERKERMLRKMQKNADRFKKNNMLLMAEAERIDMSGAAESSEAHALETCFICGLHSPTMYFPAYIQVTKVPVMARRAQADGSATSWQDPPMLGSPMAQLPTEENPSEGVQAPGNMETRWQLFAMAARGWFYGGGTGGGGGGETSTITRETASNCLPRAFPMQAMATRVCMHVVCHRCREDMRWTKYPSPPDLCSLCRQGINHFIPCFDRATASTASSGGTAAGGISAMRIWPAELPERLRLSEEGLMARDLSLTDAAMSHGHLEELKRRWWEWLGSAASEAAEELQANGTPPCRVRLDESSLSVSLAVAVVRTQLELEVAAAQVGMEARMRMLRQKFHWEAVMRYIEVSSAVSELPRSTLWHRIINFFSFPELSVDDFPQHLRKYPAPILLLEPEDCFVAAIGITGKDKDQFELALRACLNLAYLQALVSTVLHFRADERRAWCSPGEDEAPCTSDSSNQRLREHLTIVYQWLRPSLHWLRGEGRSGRIAHTGVDCDAGGEATMCCQEVISPQSVEARIQTCLLPLMRLAVIAWHRWWPDDGRDKYLNKFRSWVTTDVTDEFVNLVQSLGLSQGCLETTADLLLLLPGVSLDQVLSHLRTDISIRDPTQRIWNYLEDVLKISRYMWNPPCLLRLPHEYDAIFLPSQSRKCNQCLTTPKESAICLVCGELLCIRQRCCRGTLGNQQHVDECAIHVRRCCRGTGLFLLIRTCSILVIHGLRMYSWGTLYLDHYGDEDLSMQRGRPLFLNQDRFILLESQWLTHSLPFLPGRQWSNVLRLNTETGTRG